MYRLEVALMPQMARMYRLEVALMPKILLFLLVFGVSAAAQQPGARTWGAGAQPANTTGAATLKVTGDSAWIDSGIVVQAGDKLTIDGSSSDATCNPDGQKRSWKDLITALPVNAAGRGALVGRIGEAPAVPFLVGAHREITAAHSGHLFLGMNQATGLPSGCTFAVAVKGAGSAPAAPVQAASAGSASSAATPAALSVTSGATPVAAPASTAGAAKVTSTAPAIKPDVFDSIPRRVSDNANNPGDMVNFMIIGPQHKMEQAFQAAGWVQVDKTKSGAAIHALLSSLSKQAYTEMPMSELYLFGRSQDYGYAQADPLQVVQSRHHLRAWKAPLEIDGQEVWVGAATHDIGFEKDNRNGGITHKIDPAIDGERDFLAKSFEASGTTRSVSYITPKDPLTEAKTATGGSFHSDGRIVVLMLK